MSDDELDAWRDAWRLRALAAEDREDQQRIRAEAAEQERDGLVSALDQMTERAERAHRWQARAEAAEVAQREQVAYWRRQANEARFDLTKVRGYRIGGRVYAPDDVTLVLDGEVPDGNA